MDIQTSVIIPTYNEENYISDCLESLAGQSLGDFEVIVVDDGSTDSTLRILGDGDKKYPYKLTVLKQNHKGPGAARNTGATRAKGKILVFVDADMTFDRDFLKYLIKPILEEKSKGTFSKEEYVSNWDNVWARCWNINENLPAKRRHPSNYPDRQKVFRAILKTEFKKAGGYKPGGYTDDYSLFDSLGYMAENAPNAGFFHRNPDNLTETFRQAKWIAKRKYKMGLLGYIIALIRVIFPVSVVVGLIKAVKSGNIYFPVFKIIYDFGIFTGILEMIVLKELAK